MDQAGCERLRALQAYKRAQETLVAKRIALRDCEKSLDHLKRSLQEMDMLYNVAKSDKNACLTQIQAAMQRQTEIRDKTRIVLTEAEVGRARCALDCAARSQKPKRFFSSALFAFVFRPHG